MIGFGVKCVCMMPLGCEMCIYDGIRLLNVYL